MTNKSYHRKAVSNAPCSAVNDLKLRYPYQIKFDIIIQSANETRVNIACFYFHVNKSRRIYGFSSNVCT